MKYDEWLPRKMRSGWTNGHTGGWIYEWPDGLALFHIFCFILFPCNSLFIIENYTVTYALMKTIISNTKKVNY